MVRGLARERGCSEPGYTILREFNKVSEETPTTTTVHNTQAVNLHINLEPWDFTADHIFTPTKSIKREGEKKRPPELLWQHLDREKIEGIPLLREMLSRKSSGDK